MRWRKKLGSMHPGKAIPDLARALIALERVSHSQGVANQAVTLTQESLDFYQWLDQKLDIAISLKGIARWSSEKDAKQTAKLLGAAEAIREAIGAPQTPVDRPFMHSKCIGNFGSAMLKNRVHVPTRR